jgi:hypothetical protein
LPYFTIATRMSSIQDLPRALRDPQLPIPVEVRLNDGTATGPVPVSRLCISCERDGAATATNGMAQP